jgi:DNA methylase
MGNVIDRIEPGHAVFLQGIYSLAFALREHGWWLRNEITWAKRAPMPESCTDRPTSAWEHVFLLTKSARYYYDVEAVREECEPETADRYAAGYNASWKRAQIASVTDKRTEGFRGTPTAIKRNLRNFWLLGPSPSAALIFCVALPVAAIA